MAPLTSALGPVTAPLRASVSTLIRPSLVSSLLAHAVDFGSAISLHHMRQFLTINPAPTPPPSGKDAPFCFLSSWGQPTRVPSTQPRVHSSEELAQPWHLGSSIALMVVFTLVVTKAFISVTSSPITRVPPGRGIMAGRLALTPRSRGLFLESCISVHYPSLQNFHSHRDTQSLFPRLHGQWISTQICLQGPPPTSTYCEH